MSSGERNVEELKRLVVHTLETNGVLGQIRAELRKNVYKVIDEDETRIAPTHRPAAKLMNSPVGCLMAEIVAEFFEFYEFRHSLSVFMPEANIGRNERRSRDQVALDAGLDPRSARLADASLLEQLVGLATGSSELRKGGDCRGDDWHSSASSTTASSPPPAGPMAANRLHPSVDTSAPIAAKADLEASGKLVDNQINAAIASGGGAIGSATASAVAAGYPGTGHASSPAAPPAPPVPAAPPAALVAPTGAEEQEEASPSEESGAPEEVSNHRRPKRKQLLPSITGSKDFLGATSSGGPGQLPPLKASLSPTSLSGASDRGGAEEISLSESSIGSIGMSRETEEVKEEVVRIDRRLAGRFPSRPGAGTGLGVSPVTPAVPAATVGRDGGSSPVSAPIGVAPIASGLREFNSPRAEGEKSPEASANDLSIASVASVASVVSQVSSTPSGGPARPQPRSPANSSPANSSVALAESPLRSPPLSPRSHNSASASPLGSVADSLASPAHSAGSTPQALVDGVTEVTSKENESISIEDSSGDGDLDLALGGIDTSAGAISRKPATFPSSGAMQTVGPEDEVDEEIQEEDMSINSHESYQSSEAALSTGNHSSGAHSSGGF